MNFALLLFILILITGIICLLDKIGGSKATGMFKKNPIASKIVSKIIEYSYSFFPVFLLVFLLRAFLIEPFRIPSGSLEPTLQVGDFVAVNKFSYGIRLPIWDKKIIALWSPKRGEVAVFRWPPSPNYDYIKRVIGLPGDHISYHHKVLTINHQKMTQQFIEYMIDESSGRPVAKYEENLGGVKHMIYVRTDIPAFDFDIEVPPNAYFMMGDNRDDSADSRFWGFVDDQYLRGKAFFVWMSWNAKTSSLRWSNIGHLIH